MLEIGVSQVVRISSMIEKGRLPWVWRLNGIVCLLLSLSLWRQALNLTQKDNTLA